MKKTLFIVLLLAVLPSIASAREITVAAAANVQFPLEDLKAEFTHQSGIDVKTIIGPSGQLTSQIENGAPFDVFMSADMKYPQTLYKDGFAQGVPKVYAQGVLVLWTMNMERTWSLEFQGPGPFCDLSVLKDDRIKKIALANPQQAPYGQQTINALKFYKLYDQVYPKIVWAESIAQTNQFIMTQAADVGFTAASVVLSPQMKGKGRWVPVDPASYKPIDQGVVVLRKGQDMQKFYDFLFSPSAKAIFKKYGYKVS